jgi:hypothetical protein
MADQFCSTTSADYVQFECGSELGGIVGLGIIGSSQNPSDANLEDPDYWNNVINDSPQYFFNIKDTRGSYPGGTPIEEEGFGLVPTQRTGADHEAIIEVQGVDANRNFWAMVNQTTKWHAVLVSASGVMLYLRDASIYAKIMVDQSIKSRIRWNVSVKWSDNLSNPSVLSAPDGIFAATGSFE